MRNGFQFNDHHSSEFGVTVKTKSRPICPSVKSFTVDLPCRDGVYDFSKSNSCGRVMYNDRIITVALYAGADDIYDMQKKLTGLSLWLQGDGKLIFDDMPFIVWRGKITDEILYMPEHGGSKAVMEVSFQVKPFGQCLFGTEGPVIDVPAFKLNDNIAIGMDSMYTFAIGGKGNVRMNNFGDRPIRPVIKLGSAASGIKLALGDKYLSFTTSGETTVDFEKQNVINSNGELVNVSGEFFEFPPGEGLLHIENSNTSGLIVKFEFTPEFTYNVYFEKIKWG